MLTKVLDFLFGLVMLIVISLLAVIGLPILLAKIFFGD